MLPISTEYDSINEKSTNRNVKTEKLGKWNEKFIRRPRQRVTIAKDRIRELKYEL